MARAEWSLDELGNNDQADGVAGRVRDALVRAMSDYEDQVREWRRQVCDVDVVGGVGCRILYDDGVEVVHILANERWLGEAVWQEREEASEGLESGSDDGPGCIREAKAVTGHGIGKRKRTSDGKRKRREMGVRKRAKGLGVDHGEGMTPLSIWGRPSTPGTRSTGKPDKPGETRTAEKSR